MSQGERVADDDEEEVDSLGYVGPITNAEPLAVVPPPPAPIDVAAAAPPRILSLMDAQQAPRVGGSFDALSDAELHALLEHYFSDKDILEGFRTRGRREVIEALTRASHRITTPLDYTAPSRKLDYEHDHIEERELRSAGSFGKVFEGTFGAGLAPCAIKIVKIRDGLTNRDGTPIDRIRSELAALDHCRHPNLITFYGYARKSDTEVAVLMELADMDLLDFCADANYEKLNRGERLQILQQIADGLNWLHTRDPAIVHLDLKAENILKIGGVFKLTDFGLSAFLPRSHGAILFSRIAAARTQLPGNLAHMAPEIMRHEPFTTKADVFSFGILAWELLFHDDWSEAARDHFKDAGNPVPDEHASTENAKSAIYQSHFRTHVAHEGFRPRLSDTSDQSTRDFLTRLWDQDLDKRPTMLEVSSILLPDLYFQYRLTEVDRWLSFDSAATRFWVENFEPYLIRYFTCSASSSAASSSSSSSFSSSSSASSSSSSSSSSSAASSSSSAASSSSKPPSSAIPHSLIHRGRSLGDVPWAAFWQACRDFVQVHQPDADLDQKMQNNEKWMKNAMGIASEARAESAWVTLQHFAQLVGAFGPLLTPTTSRPHDPKPFFSRVFTTMRYGYFQPMMRSEEQMELVLKGTQVGTYIVRYSSKPGVAFTLARVESFDIDTCNIAQHRLTRLDPEKPDLSVENQEIFETRTWPGLNSLVQDRAIVEYFNLNNHKPWPKNTVFWYD